MAPLNSDFLQSDKPQRKRKEVIYELDAGKDVPGRAGGRDSPCLILEFSHVYKIQLKTEVLIPVLTKPRSEVTRTKKDNAFFTHRTVTPTT